MEYPDVVSLFERLKNKVRFDVTPHMLRHTSLTELRKAGWKDEHLMKRAGHAHVQTTMQMYIHTSDEDIRVSMESGVSKAYLYNHSDARDRIETLRRQQEGLPSPKQVKREMTDASKDVLIAAKNKRIKALEEENKRLKSELATLRGKLYDRA